MTTVEYNAELVIFLCVMGVVGMGFGIFCGWHLHEWWVSGQKRDDDTPE